MPLSDPKDDVLKAEFPSTRTPAEVAGAFNTRSHRDHLTSLLRKINSPDYFPNFVSSETQTKNIDLLGQNDSVAIVTGQQMGAFLGPAFTFHKIVSCLEAAKRFEKQYRVPCVPVFWLQVEDHDLEEVRSTSLFDSAANPIKVEISAINASASRTSLRYVLLPEDLPNLLATIESALKHLPFGQWTTGLVRRAYVPGRTYADAFAALASALFADSGLVFFDPRHPDARTATKPVFNRALAESSQITTLLQQQIERLHKKGIEPIVHVRSNSPLVFYQPEGEKGARYRVERQESGDFTYIGKSGTISEGELLTACERDPFYFSSSALIRPILQDTLLPTYAYIGGNSELKYFLQLAPLYEKFGIPRPQVLPRASYVLVEPKSQRYLEELGIGALDLQLDDKSLFAKISSTRGTEPFSPVTLRSDATNRAKELFELLAPAVTAIDTTLQEPLRKTKENVERSLEQFFGRYEKAFALRDSVQLERLGKLRALLQPGGLPQERAYSILPFLARIGPELINRLGSQFEPDLSQPIVVPLGQLQANMV